MAQARHDIADGRLADAGGRRIGWADRSMPVLRTVRERFAVDRPFRGLTIGACLQVTAETAVLAWTLAAGGAKVALAASNPLATQDDTAAALVHHHDISVFARAGADSQTYQRHIEAVLEQRPAVVFDEGGDLVHALHTSRTDLVDTVRAGCEATETGVVRLRQMWREDALLFPVVALADTPTRRILDNRYGTGQSVLDGVMRGANVLLAGATVVIAGYGQCGTGLAERARGLGAQVVVTEVDPVRALDAALQGHRVLPMAAAAPVGDVFITATGSMHVVAADHFAAMKDGAILANAGHFDLEIDVRALEALAVERRPAIRPQADEYLLADGRRLLLLGEGRVVNLTVAEGNPAAAMDTSFAEQALTAAWLADPHTDLAPGVYDVPAPIDREVAALKLASMDLTIDTPTPDQEAYRKSWR